MFSCQNLNETPGLKIGAVKDIYNMHNKKDEEGKDLFLLCSEK